jgi:CRISPR-associated endoribonuclease Cas6
MHYFELTVTSYLLKDVAFNEVNEKISQLINKVMLADRDLAIKHEENKYKNYVFDSLYPREKDKIYKAGKIYVFRIRSLEEYFITNIKELLSEITTDYFKVISSEITQIKQRTIKELYTVTPALATIGKNIYWVPGDDLKLLVERMNVNLFKKYKKFFGISLNEEQLFFDKIKILNKKPFVYKYKNTNLFGNKFKIAINDDEISQKLAFLTLGVGLLEKNSTVGMGFCIKGKGV